MAFAMELERRPGTAGKSMRGSRRQCDLGMAILGRLLFLLCIMAQAQASYRIRRLPHLENAQYKSYFLKSGEVWKPSQNTLLTALNAHRPLQMQLVPKYGEIKSSSLIFKCLYEERYSEINLEMMKPLTPSTWCDPVRPFTIVRERPHGNNNHSYLYNITLSGTSQLILNESMVHSLEFQVAVTFNEGTARYGSLFVFNLDSIMKINLASTVTSNVNATRYILSEAGAKFFTIPNKFDPNDNRKIKKVQLLEPTFVRALNRAALIIRSTLVVTVLIRGNRPCDLDPENDDGDIIFTSGEPKTGVTDALADLRFKSIIDLQRGTLTYSVVHLFKARNSLETTFRSQPIRVCLRILLNPPVWDYALILPVFDPLHVPSVPYPGPPATISWTECQMPSIHNTHWLVLNQGMEMVLLINPIICSEETVPIFTVLFNDEECTNFISGSALRWQPCGRGLYTISRSGNGIWITGPLHQGHSGSYKFLSKYGSYTYIITVSSLPLFNTDQDSGALPHVTYANLDSQVTFNCTVYHDGMGYVYLEPSFRVLLPYISPTWQELTIDDFALRVMKKEPGSIKQSVNQLAAHVKFSNIHVVMPHVDPEWKAWVLTFSCRAHISNPDAYLIGIPYYWIASSTEVLYVGTRFQTGKYSTKGTHLALLPTEPLISCLCIASLFLLIV